MAKTVDLKCGDRKFSTSQNFTGAEVRFVTDSIIIRMRRSYRWPLAREKTCTVSSSSFAAATAAASPPAAGKEGDGAAGDAASGGKTDVNSETGGCRHF